MKTKTIILGVYALIVLMFSACTKAKDGAPGAQGPAGVSGTAGIDGNDGNAKVYNYTFNLNLSGFIGPVTNGAYTYVFNPTSVMGSDFISENDAVLLYLFDHTTSGTDYYNALPFLDYFNTGTSFNQHSFELGATGAANILIFNIRNSAGGSPYTDMTTGTLSYKMIWIEGIGKSLPLDGVDKKDYYAVCKAFGLTP